MQKDNKPYYFTSKEKAFTINVIAFLLTLPVWFSCLFLYLLLMSDNFILMYLLAPIIALLAGQQLSNVMFSNSPLYKAAEKNFKIKD